MTGLWSRRAALRTFGATATAGTLSATAGAARAEPTDEWPIAQRLGSTHVDPNYVFTERDALNEGAGRLQELGTEVIKIWFHYMDEKYDQHSDWPSSFETLVDRAEHPYLQELFDRPFETFILVAYSESPGEINHYFRDGVSSAQYEQEVQEFYNLSKHLLETYRGTDKEFILQHWQGDWAILGNYNDSREPADQAVEGMARWLNARQEGVTKARREVDSDVTVLHAAEINIVVPAMRDDERRVINAVVPETNVDLVSHNSYRELWEGWVPPNPNAEIKWQNVTPPEQVDLLYRTLDYVNDLTPDPPKYVQDRLVDPQKNVFVGEYGFPANPPDRVDDAARFSRLATDVSLDWGARWVVFWQLYDNSPNDSGFWLIRPDGTKAPTYDYFETLFAENEVPTPTEYVELTFEFDRLVDERAFACSELVLGDRDAGTPKRYDIGVYTDEPIIWSGSFWTDEHNGRTSRWFGGNGGVTRLFVPQRTFDGARIIHLHGHPREEGITTTVSVDGETVDSLTFGENRWRDWTASLGSERTATPSTEPYETDTLTDTTRASGEPASDRNSTFEAGDSPKSVTTTEGGFAFGFGALGALAGVGSLAYREYLNEVDDSD